MPNTPPPGARPTPYTPAPGSYAPVNAISTQYPSGIHQPAPSKTPWLIGGGILLAAGIAAAVLLGGGNDGEKAQAAAAAQPVESGEELPVEVEPPPVAEPVTPEVTPPVEPAVKIINVSAGVTSSPKGAEIYVNEVFEGKTPAKLRYESEELPLQIVLKKRGYEDLTFHWEFNPDQKKQRYNFNQAMTKESRSSSRSNKSSGKSTTTSTKVKTDLAVPTLDKVKKTPKDKQGDNMMVPDL